MKRSIRVVATAALASSALAVLAVVAAAHTARFNSTVTISFQRGHSHESDDTFSGEVTSAKHRCERHRKVVLRERVDGPDVLFGKDLTNRDGEWEVHVASTPAGDYYAKARKKVLRRNSAHRHICKPALSPDLTVHGNPSP
jgi:hypothetical protein